MSANLKGLMGSTDSDKKASVPIVYSSGAIGAQDTLRTLFNRGLSLLNDEATAQEWRDLIWELQRAVRAHVAALNAVAEAKAVEGMGDAERERRAARVAFVRADLGI